MTLVRATIARDVSLEGIGLFTGADTRVTIRPASDGISFQTAGDPPFPASADHLTGRPVHPAFARLAPRHTNLAADDEGVVVATVEHVLSALVGMGVTDARVELRGPEVPIFDGSALPFTDAIAEAGLAALDPQHPLTLDEPVQVTDADASVTIEPADHAHYTYTLDYGPDAPIAPATVSWSGQPGDYRRDIAPARTFSLLHEARQMQALGLFARFTPSDLLVIGPDGPVDNALRFDDEPARHKLLDLIGDLALVARPLRARVTAVRSGHALHHQAARAVAAQQG